MRTTLLNIVLGVLCATIVGCNSTTVRTTATEEVVAHSVVIPEELLLDVGVGILDAGIEGVTEDAPGVYPGIREAEARYMAYALSNTVQDSGNWGIVRVVPERLSEMDVWLDGKIIKSDGAILELEISLYDSSGDHWYTRRYSGTASKYSYDNTVAKRGEPFQGVYNQITNDMLAYYQRLTPAHVRAMRTITELKFAKAFSGESYAQHLGIDDKGHLFVKRLPAADDPILMRIRQMRERDYMFVDTMQEYYGSFVRQMYDPYLEWRRAFYEEDQALREVKSQANQRLIGGILAVAAGILAQGTGSRTARTAGHVAIGAGASAIYSGMHKREEAKVHAEALEEISNSMRSEMEPHRLQLDERTVTLSGSVQDQYGQWRQILQDMYERETGQSAPVTQ